jgi:hypothetical protein
LGHLRGSLPQVFSEAVFPATTIANGGVGGRARKAGGTAVSVELSANCSSALVRRLIEEGEDIRLNYRCQALGN